MIFFLCGSSSVGSLLLHAPVHGTAFCALHCTSCNSGERGLWKGSSEGAY